MSINLKIASICFSLFIIVFVLVLLHKNRISVKYAIIWLLLFSLSFLTILIPGLLENVTKFFGFQVGSNMIFSILIGLLVTINIILTMIVSSQDKKIRLLIQEVSLLKGQKNEG